MLPEAEEGSFLVAPPVSHSALCDAAKNSSPAGAVLSCDQTGPRCEVTPYITCFGTIARPEFIIVLDQGRIVEDGRYSELLERNGLYAGTGTARRARSPTPKPRRLLSEAIGDYRLVRRSHRP